ncbi:hypothetical protein CVV38_03205 [Candidatus Peregrinibacteria bacterium HGW-Peregrinibacteria-1]|jgi:ABC-type glycerol-3-phosphate transport system substrate-binding protein|nr:MAG: hypothetical protein CVV38_03205 [Candidatus Peregrinibacteria bacterium HGW-Peregrinibacteria-1]
MNKKVLLVTLIISSLLIIPACRTKAPGTPLQDYTGVELTYYKLHDNSEVISPYIDEFIKTHPGLKINYRKFTDQENYETTILNEMAAGKGPDIISMPNTWFASNYQKTTPLPQEFASIDQYDQTFVSIASKDLIFEDYAPSTDQEETRRIYGIPLHVNTLALFYNKQHFEEKLPQRGRPAGNWNQIREETPQLTLKNTSFTGLQRSAIALGTANNISLATDIIYLLLLQGEISFYNQSLTAAIFSSDGAAAADNKAFNIIDFYTSFASESKPNYTWNKFVTSDAPGQEIQAFAKGEVSMIIGYPETYQQILGQIEVLKNQGEQTIVKDNIRISPIPQITTEESGSKKSTYAKYYAETVSRNSQHSELAWEFIVFMAQQENAKKYFEATKKPTSRRDLIEEQSKHPIYGVFVSQIGYAESIPMVNAEKYREIITTLINKINTSGLQQTDIKLAQYQINQLIPTEGVINK